MELLRKLCTINGCSGDETDIRNFILKEISSYCNQCYEDKLGNLIAFKKGKKVPDKKIMYSAHMDETGYMVKSIDDDGCIRIDSIGVSPNVTTGKTVIIKSTKKPTKPQNVYGIIGLLPIHLTKAEDRNKVPDFEKIRIDIGSNSKEETANIVELGDYVYFVSEFDTFGKYIKAKAFDNRIGCYTLIELIKKDLEYDSWFSFCVQEEIGCRGAKVVAAAIQPDIVFVLEGTTAADISGVDDDSKVCFIGKGPAISFADKTTFYNPDMVIKLTELANNNNISWQYKSFVAGGNDASSMQRSAAGAKVLAISAPVRYLHSRISVASFKDIEQMLALCQTIDKNVDIFCRDK